MAILDQPREETLVGERAFLTVTALISNLITTFPNMTQILMICGGSLQYLAEQAGMTQESIQEALNQDETVITEINLGITALLQQEIFAKFFELSMRRGLN